jgi:hypothetical protein
VPRVGLHRYRRESPEVRFWVKVRFSDGCWEWSGAVAKGYGQVRRDGQAIQAHRIAYEFLVGAIPEGMGLDHLCCNKRCVNPSHLEAVTQRENIIRGLRRRTHCEQGHPLSPENVCSGSIVQCLACRRKRKREYVARRRKEALV